jgi:hypothetical protein
VDQSGGAGLPAGFVLAGQSGSSSPHFSVDAVSGTFSDALPDTLPDGTYALNMSSGGFAELARLIGRRGTGEAASANHSDADSAAGDGESGDGLDFGSGDDAPAPAQLAMDSPVLSFGVVFGLGAACTMTVPNRRRNTDWARRLMEFLGVG